MGLPGLFFSERDVGTIHGINNELLDVVIQTEVTLYKPVADVTNTNIYGETKMSVARAYYPGIQVTALIDRAEIATDVDDFGPTRKQNVVFKFLEAKLKEVNFFPQTGDLILFNERYHEVDNVVQEQFLGGVDDKSFSIITNTHYTRLSKADILIRQS